MISNEFQIDLGVLNRLSTVERSLDNFLYACRSMNVQIDLRHSTTTELLERYMAAVRSRNKVRRNWHPSKAHSCDIETLQWITKEDFKKAATNHLRDALTVTTGGNKSIQENCIDDLANKLTDEFYNRKRKRSKPTTFQSVVREIRKLTWVKTTTDVIDEMRSNPREYGIVKIDDTYVEIEVSLGVGKDTKIISRSLDSIKNIK
jgi:hypothetical protein